MKTQCLPRSPEHLLALPSVTLERVHQKGLDAVIVRRGSFREFHITLRPIPGDRQHYWCSRLALFLREHGGKIVKHDMFGSIAACEDALERMHVVFGDVTWPVTCAEGRASSGNGIAGTQILAIADAEVKTVMSNWRPVGCVFNDGWARHCVLGELRARDVSTSKATQAAQVYEEIEQALADEGFALGNLVRTWLFIEDILDWYGAFNQVRTKVFRDKNLFSKLIPASTGIGAKNRHGAALVAGAWAMQPMDDSSFTISEVGSPLQCSARKYGSCFSRAVEIRGAGLSRLLVSGTASIDPAGRSAREGDLAGQIQLTMEVVEAILRSRRMRWTDVSRATAYLKHCAAAPVFADWCNEHEVRLPAIEVQSHLCRDELLFEIEVDALIPTEDITTKQEE